MSTNGPQYPPYLTAATHAALSILPLFGWNMVVLISSNRCIIRCHTSDFVTARLSCSPASVSTWKRQPVAEVFPQTSLLEDGFQVLLLLGNTGLRMR